MNISTSIFAGLPLAILLCSCNEPVANKDSRPSHSRNILLELAARADRGPENIFFRLESEIPGFGGFFIQQPNNVLVFYIRDMTHADAARTALIARKEGELKGLFEILGPQPQLEARQGNWAFSELIEWQIKLAETVGPIAAALDADEARNRVSIEVLSSTDEAEIRRIAESLNIPDSALRISIIPELPRTAADLRGRSSPTTGGIQIQAAPGTSCSLGYNTAGLGGIFVNYPDTARFLVTAGHCYNDSYGTTGVVGGLVGQPKLGSTASPGDTIATIVYNPSWNVTGGVCTGFALCTTADVLLARYDRARTADRTIAGARMINSSPWYFTNTYPTGWGFWTSYVGTDILKVSQQTGTRRGRVLATCVARTLYHGPFIGNVRHTCVHDATNYTDLGDSGGAVFYNGDGTSDQVTAASISSAYGIVTGMDYRNNLIFTGGTIADWDISWYVTP